MASNNTFPNIIKHPLDSSLHSLDQIDFCDDIFDIEDHDQDIMDDQETILYQYNHNFDFEGFHRQMDDEEMDNDNSYQWDYSKEEVEEVQQVLSQKLSQLSTTNDDINVHDDETEHTKKRSCSNTPSTPTTTVKKTRLDSPINRTINNDTEIPEYLQIQQKLFQDHIIHLISKFNLSLTVEEIQSIVILKHRIASTTLDHQLWTAYLAVGIGEWSLHEKQKSFKVDQRFWSESVKEKLITTINDPNQLQQSYEAITRQQLIDYVSSIEKYEQQLQTLLETTTDLSDVVNRAIDQYVENYGIRPLKIRIDYLIKKLEYDRDIAIDEREGQRRQPTEYQSTTLQRLYELILNKIKAKQIVNELQQRILCDRPMERTYVSTEINDLNHTSHDYERSIQQSKTDQMLAMLLHHEQNIQRSQEAFNQVMKEANMKDAFDIDYSIRHFLDLINHRFDLYQNKMRCLAQYRFSYHLRNRYDTSLAQLEQERFRQLSPSLIIDISSHGLTHEQLRLLHRGPSYVPPCQRFVRPIPRKLMNDECLNNLFASFKHQLNILFAKYQVNMAQSMFLQQEMFDAFHRTFSVFIPSALYQRAVYEQQLIDSIRKHLKDQQIILRRTADQRNIFYMGNRQEFHRRSQQFMLDTDRFEYCDSVDHQNLQTTYDFLHNVIRTMNQELYRLFNGNKFHMNLIQKLSSDMNKIILPYLYFLPDVSQTKEQNPSMVPIVIAHRSITSKMAQYLDELLRPIVERSIHSSNWIDGADFIRKLYQCSYTERRLRPKTLLVSMKILQFDTPTTHSNMLLTLEGFLHDTLIHPNIENMSLTKFLDLMGFFLRNNYFYYDNAIYRFVKGGPQHMPIIETLSNMFICTWQTTLIQELSLSNEFFGRCRDRLFFTWNQSSELFEQAIERVRQRVSQVKFETKINFQVDFLQVYIENRQGVLYTRVYHDPFIQKYTLPFVNRHAYVEHSHWLRSSLIQAVRYCTSVEDFNHERAYLQVTLLANGYGLEFIEKRMAHFYQHFDVVSLRQTFNQQVYDRLRHQMFNFSNEQNKKCKEEQELEERKQLVHLTYSYQYGPCLEFERQCQQLLSQQLASRLKILPNKMKIILQTKQQYTLNALLSQQKPSNELLSRK